MLDFYKPNWLYEGLPYLYVAAGAITIAALQHGLSFFSGGLLIMTGVYVWTIRRINRSRIGLAPRPRKFHLLNRLR